MVGLVKTIFFIALFYYGFRFLTRYVFPFFLKKWVNKKMGQFDGQAKTGFKSEEEAKNFAKKHEGEVEIKSKPHKTETEGLGEEVDFEELE